MNELMNKSTKELKALQNPYDSRDPEWYAWHKLRSAIIEARECRAELERLDKLIKRSSKILCLIRDMDK